MESNNSIKITIFIIILLVIIVGGYILMNNSNKLANKTDNKVVDTPKEQKSIKLDSTKDYIYFDDNDPVVSELEIDYKRINFNFKDTNLIAQTLNNETTELRKTVKFDDTLDDETYDKLSEAKYKIYEYYVSDKNISLVVRYYSFDSVNLGSYETTKTYNFDITNGNLIKDEDLLSIYNITKDNINDKIKTYIEDQDLLREDNLDSEQTIKNGYALYINKFGKLMASVVVKSDLKDYNDNINLS